MLCTHCLVVQELPQNKLTVPAMMFKALSISLCQVATFKRGLGVLKMVITVIHESLRKYYLPVCPSLTHLWRGAHHHTSASEYRLLRPLAIGEQHGKREIYFSEVTMHSHPTQLSRQGPGSLLFPLEEQFCATPHIPRWKTLQLRLHLYLDAFPSLILLPTFPFWAPLLTTYFHKTSCCGLWVFGRWLKFKESRDTSGYVYACETIQCSLYFSSTSRDQEEEKGQSELKKVYKEITSCPSW